MANITANVTRKSATDTILRRLGRSISEIFVSIAQRRTLRELGALDDHQLADIGLRREQLTTGLFASERHTVQ